MSSPAPFAIHTLSATDVPLLVSLLSVFSEAFEDPDNYQARPPSAAYLERLLRSESFIAIVALVDDEVVGGIGAYELQKFEQERSEIYLYDLAVLEAHRRQGIATALIRELSHIAHERGARVVFVQADLEDDPAIQLYTSLGIREDVLHFDIEARPRDTK